MYFVMNLKIYFFRFWANLNCSIKIYYLTSGRYSRKLQVDDEIDAFAHTILVKGAGYIGAYTSDELFDIPIPIQSTDKCMEDSVEIGCEIIERPSKRLRR